MSDTSGQLAERGHLFGVDQACLRGPQFGERPFSSITSGTDLFFRPLSLGNVTVDQPHAASCHAVSANLDDPTVRTGAFKAQFLVCMFKPPTEFGLNVVATKLAALCQVADVLSVKRT